MGDLKGYANLLWRRRPNLLGLASTGLLIAGIALSAPALRYLAICLIAASLIWSGLPGINDLPTLDYIAHVVGEEHVPSTLGNARSNSGNENSVATVAVLPPTVVRQMRRGRALLIHGTLPAASVRVKQP